jgi:hypothetical protein
LNKQITIRFVALVITVAFILGTLGGNAAYAIKYGQPDEDAHPYVGWIVLWDGVSEYVYLCSGSLIAPDVVLCAGHCTDIEGIVEVWVSFDATATWDPPNAPPLGDDASSNGWIPAASWQHHPSYSIGGVRGLTDWITNDVGIIMLEESVSLPQYATLPLAGLVDTLPMGQNVDLVGYGVQYHQRGGGYIDFATRYNATAQLLTSDPVLSDEFMRLTANPGKGKGSTCFGDSGSPILLAGTNTVLGVCSWGTNGNCAGLSYEQRIDLPDILSWINGFLVAS